MATFEPSRKCRYMFNRSRSLWKFDFSVFSIFVGQCFAFDELHLLHGSCHIRQEAMLGQVWLLSFWTRSLPVVSIEMLQFGKWLASPLYNLLFVVVLEGHDFLVRIFGHLMDEIIYCMRHQWPDNAAQRPTITTIISARAKKLRHKANTICFLFATLFFSFNSFITTMSLNSWELILGGFGGPSTAPNYGASGAAYYA